MTFRAKQIEVPESEPFKNDALSRENATTSVAEFIGNVNGPFVLALNSPWGTGKTTFVKMLKATLEKDEVPCIYFDAWRNDFASDPLVAFVGELEKAFEERSTKKSKARKKFADVRKAATALAKKAVPIAGKLATAGILDIESVYEDALGNLAKDALNDAIDAYSTERNMMTDFRTSLEVSVAALLEPVDADKIVILVDELDRCRPTYAVDLLERIKHLFDVENVVFVLSLDKTQLGISLGAVYGEKIDSTEYLRRFIDMEFTLPKPDPEAFTNHLFRMFELQEQFADRNFREFQTEAADVRETFKELSNIFNLSLRAREQCFTSLRVALLITPNKNYIFPYLITTLAVLRIGAPDVYREYAHDGGDARRVVDLLRELPGGPELFDKNVGKIIEAYLVAAKYSRFSDGPSELLNLQKEAKNAGLAQEERDRISRVVEIAEHIVSRDRSPPLDYVVSRLELASEFKIR